MWNQKKKRSDDTMRCEDAQELITAMVDKELPGGERSLIEAHFGQCATCAFAYAEERALKARTRRVAAEISAPRELRERIVAQLRGSSARDRSRWAWSDLFGAWRSAVWPVFAVAMLVLLALPVFHLIQPREPIALAALQTHQRILGGAATLVRAGSEAEVKEHLFRSVAGRFAPMGYDLSAMKLRVVGGLVDEVRGRKILVTVYEGENPSLTCFTFLGTEQDTPRDAELFLDPEKRVNFYLFSLGGVNGVLHREGDLICILVSKMPISELLAVARSKARPS
jgi:mycothiol system anti-sigma-R factor